MVLCVTQAAINAEIENGRVEVARLRAKQGGGRLGSLEMGPLSLPNPGGGQVSVGGAGGGG